MAENKQNKRPNVPPLRFPEFTGDWETQIINDVCDKFQSGRFIKANLIKPIGAIPVYGGNGLRGYTDIHNHIGDYVLIGRQGALCGNVRFVSGKTYITEHAIAVKGKETTYTRFLLYLFEKMNLGQFSDQSAQPGLAVNKLQRIKINIPHKNEQKKIAEFLGLLDQRIAVQSKLIEDLQQLKSALVERLYCQHNPNFKIGDLVVQVSKRNRGDNDYSVLSVNNRLGFIEQSEQFEDRSVASEDTSNYKVVSRDDFAYNPARINVGSIARLTSFENGIVSPMYICFHTKKQLLPQYLEHFFDTHYFFYEMQKRLEGSVRLCLSWEGICNIPISVPSIEWQEKIGKRISRLADKIELEVSHLNLLNTQKQYLLQAMFI